MSLIGLNPNAEVLNKSAALHMNINAAKGLQDVLKSNLGPKGTIKMYIYTSLSLCLSVSLSLSLILSDFVAGLLEEPVISSLLKMATLFWKKWWLLSLSLCLVNPGSLKGFLYNTHSLCYSHCNAAFFFFFSFFF